MAGEVQVYDGDGESQEMADLRRVIAEQRELNVLICVERDEAKNDLQRAQEDLAEKDRRIAELEALLSVANNETLAARSDGSRHERDANSFESQFQDAQRKIRDLESRRRW